MVTMAVAMAWAKVEVVMAAVVTVEAVAVMVATAWAKVEVVVVQVMA